VYPRPQRDGFKRSKRKGHHKKHGDPSRKQLNGVTSPPTKFQVKNKAGKIAGLHGELEKSLKCRWSVRCKRGKLDGKWEHYKDGIARKSDETSDLAARRKEYKTRKLVGREKNT